MPQPREPSSPLKRTFGLSRDDWNGLVAAQGGVCPICLKGSADHVDRDHRTGTLRGVLCGPCNMGLGQFGDSPRRLRAAADYVLRHQTAALGIAVEEVRHDADCCVIEVDFMGHAA